MYALYVQIGSPLFLCVDGKMDTGVYTYWFLPCLLGVDEACVCIS